MKISDWIRRRERAKFLEGVSGDRKEKVGRVYDVLDEIGGLSGDSFAMRVLTGANSIFLIFIAAWIIFFILQTTIHIEQMKWPMLALGADFAFVLYSLWTSVRAVRHYNTSRREARKRYEDGWRAAELEAIDEAVLKRKFAGFAEWPLWIIHVALMLWIAFAFCRHIQIHGW